MRALSTRDAPPVLTRGRPKRTQARQAGAWRKFRRTRLAGGFAWPVLGVVAALAIGAWTWHTGIVGENPGARHPVAGDGERRGRSQRC